MIIPAIKIAILILMVFSYNIFARRERLYERKGSVVYCSDTLGDYIEKNANDLGGFDYIEDDPFLPPGFTRKSESMFIYTNNNVSKDTTKMIFCGDIGEVIRTKYDSAGNLRASEYEVTKDRELISSRLEVWKGGKLVRIKYNNRPMSIVQGKTPCNLEIFEPSGKSLLVLDPKNKPDTLIRKITIDSAEIYDAIKYHWYPHCKKYYESKKSAEINLNQEKELDTFAKDDDSSSFYIYSYKCYAVIIACIAVASVAIIRKRRRAGK